MIRREDPAAPSADVQTSSDLDKAPNPSNEQPEQVTATGTAANGLASSEEMLSIAGLLDWEPEVSGFGNDQLAGSWLWTDAMAQDLDFGGDLL